MRTRLVGAAIALAFSGVLAWGCVGDVNSGGGPDASSDQMTADAPTPPPPDSGLDAPVEAASPYNDLADQTRWTLYNLASIPDAGAHIGGYAGAAFDGRYVYLVPFNDGTAFHGTVARYDTQGTFTSASSWAFVDLPALGVDANARGFAGATFDGRYVYFVPQVNPNQSGLTVRYDTTQPFAALASWQKFDLATANGNALCFNSAAFDGTNLYYSPNCRTVIAKYDTTQVFTNTTGWSFFDPTTLFGATAQGFGAAAFDSKYVYFVPTWQMSSNPRSVFVRYDKSKPFGDSTAWTSFDSATGIDPTAKGFFGSVFDGRYLTVAPWNNGTGFDGIAVRYDTTLSFTDQGSWSRFDTTTVAPTLKGFGGAQFDGQYVYFVPSCNSGGAVTSGCLDGVVGRFDPTNWSATASWTTFDVTGLNAGARGFGGSAFDGRYVYLVPNHNAIIARFEARKTAMTVDPKRPASFF